MRFSLLQEPSGSWLVFDDLLDGPAEIAGRTMIGLCREDAAQVAASANEDMVRTRPPIFEFLRPI